MHNPETPRVKLSSIKILMVFAIKNPATPSYAKFSSLSTGEAEFFIFIVLRVPFNLDFFYFT